MISRLKEYQQLPLRLADLESREVFPLGTRSSKVFCGIVNRHQVAKFAVTSYFPDGTYKHDPAQKVHWIDGRPSETELFNQSVRLRQGLTFDFEGEVIDLRSIMGVCSMVETADGSKHHIPMLDFCIGVGGDSLRTIRSSLALPKGALLETDNSYHYYGYDLMDESSWCKWMHNIRLNIRRKNLLKDVIDQDYLDYSIRRGYAALRVFRYPETTKITIPFVVGYVTLD